MSEEVRLAEPPDEPGIMAICRGLHEENGKHPLDEQKVLTQVRRALYKQGGIVGVIGETDDIRGAVLLSLEPVWYSTEWHMVELFNCVRPDCRKSEYAKRLIEYSKKMSDQTGLELMIGVISDERMEAKLRLYRRQLPLAGHFFRHSPANPLAQ